MQEIIRALRQNQELLKEFSVKSLSVFGSVARGESNPESDIDILVEFYPDACIGFFTFARLQQRLSDILCRPVDLVTPEALHGSMRKQILEESIHAV